MDDAAFIARFRRAAQPRPHPGTYAGPHQRAAWEDFSAVLTSVGGTALQAVVGDAALREAVSAAIAFVPGRVVAGAGAARLLAGIPGWSPASGSLADAGLGIVTGRLAVAENAAVLIDAECLPERSLLVLAQHLLVLVPADALVGGFTEAQGVLASRPAPWYATWISGPSKTADIEQTLVIGAHGARTLSVLPFAA